MTDTELVMKPLALLPMLRWKPPPAWLASWWSMDFPRVHLPPMPYTATARAGGLSMGLQSLKKTKNFLVFSIKQPWVRGIPLPSGPSTAVPAGRSPFWRDFLPMFLLHCLAVGLLSSFLLGPLGTL